VAADGGGVRISAVVLAAGSARRFGGDKLKADVDGKPVFQHVFNALSGFDFHEILAVVRPDYHLDAPGVRILENPQAEAGMGRSLALGIAKLAPTDAAFVVLADMPFLPDGIFHQVTLALPGYDIVAPRHNGQIGHPVLFSSACFADLKALDGDRGGRALIESGRYRVGLVDCDSNGVLRDVDRPDDLRP
jgi:molybdenum cofactor cytidylyltransferase